MKRLRKWLIENYLPMWAKEVLWKENRQLRREVRQLRQQLAVMEAYQKGLQRGLRQHCRHQEVTQ